MKKISYEETGERIREMRKNSGLTVEKLAEALQVTQEAVKAWQRGRNLPSVEHLVQLAELLRTTVDGLRATEEVEEKEEE